MIAQLHLLTSSQVFGVHKLGDLLDRKWSEDMAKAGLLLWTIELHILVFSWLLRALQRELFTGTRKTSDLDILPGKGMFRLTLCYHPKGLDFD